MNFRSDNEVGAHPRIVEAVSRAFASGSAPSYGADDWTQRVEHRLRELFEKPDLVAFPVVTGTAANVPVAGLLHAAVGRDLLPSAGPHRRRRGRRAGILHGGRQALPDRRRRPARSIRRSSPRRWPSRSTACVHHPQPAAVSITQATECGTVYAPEEIAAIATSTHRHGLKLHMDGARFANALSFVGCAPAELSWKAGVDVLSLGATKNGALAAEAVVFFDAESGARVRVPPQARRASACPRCASCRRSSTPTCRRPVARQRPPCQRHGAPAGGRADGAQGHAASLPGRRQRDLRRHAGAHARCAAGRRRAVPSLAVGPAGRARLPPRHGVRYRSQPTSIASSPSPRPPDPMTHQRTLTAAHWGVYEVEYDDSRQGHAPASFLQGSRSLADRPAHAVRRGDAAARAPAGRAQELARARPRRRCPSGAARSRSSSCRWDEALDLLAQELARVKSTLLQPRDLRRLLRLVERRPLPSRAKPGPSLPEFDRRLRAPPGFLQPGGGARADAAHRGADGRADVHAHAAGTCWPSTASCSSPSAACRTRTARSTPAAPPCITSRAASTPCARRACASST